MNKLLSAEEIAKSYDFGTHCNYSQVMQAIREGMRQGRDAALEWSADIAGSYVEYNGNRDECIGTILSGKTHPDLEIK